MKKFNISLYENEVDTIVAILEFAYRRQMEVIKTNNFLSKETRDLLVKDANMILGLQDLFSKDAMGFRLKFRGGGYEWYSQVEFRVIKNALGETFDDKYSEVMEMTYSEFYGD